VIEVPDVLVLGGGGALGEAWMTGLLRGLESGGLDFRACEYFVGTSAGAVVAATLAAGERPRPVKGEPGEELALVGAAEMGAGGDRGAGGPGDRGAGGPGDRGAGAGEDRDVDSGGGRGGARGAGDAVVARLGVLARGARRAGAVAATPFAPALLATATPAGRLARAAVLRAGPRPERTLSRLREHLETLGARFDGRLRVTAVDRANGRRVVFGAPNAPRASVSDAVLASCAVPWVFAPVAIDGRDYVDGGVWSPTNLDVAPAGRGARVLCLMPTAGAQEPFRTGTLAAAGTEALALRARGATVRTIAPDAPTIEAFGPSLLDPRNRDAVAAAGFAQGRRMLS
jgi:NTE family protein